MTRRVGASDAGYPPITDLPVMRPVAGHFAAVPFFVTDSMFGGLPFEVAGGDISGRVGQPVAELHSHPVPEVYLLVSPTPGGAAIAITRGDEQFTVESPAAVFIPAEVPHRFETLDAERGSCCFGILVGGGHDQ